MGVVRRGPGNTLTVLVLFAVVVIAVILIFTLFRGMFNLNSGASGSVDMTGLFQVPGGAGGEGTLVIMLTNTGSVPVTRASLSCPSVDFATSDCALLNFLLQGVPVSGQNPLGQNGSATLSGKVHSALGTSFTYSRIYMVTCSVTFSDGTEQSKALSVSPHA